MVKIVRFGRDRSIHKGNADPLPLEGIFRVTDTKAFKLSSEPACQLWTYPLMGFGGKIRFIPEMRSQPLLTQVIGEGVTLTPSRGRENHYRDGTFVDFDDANRLSTGAEFLAAQRAESGQVKQKGEKLLNWLGIAFILELIIFAAVVLPVAIPKVLESLEAQP